jgi:hypothetical protein
MQLEMHQMSTQSALINMKTKLDTIPSALDSPFQRQPSSASIRSITPSEAVSPVGSPQTNSPQHRPLNGTPVASLLTFSKQPLPASPSVSVSAFSLPADKKEEAVPGTKERGSFEQTRGNWGNRIVLTTYPGQANVGILPLLKHALVIVLMGRSVSAGLG